jgi:hypothetical protein
MNIILLSIWIKILLITLLCVYYHFEILNKFLVSHKPTQPGNNILCQYTGLPTVDLSTLSVCRVTDGIKSYSYTSNGVTYEIAQTQQMYTKVCSGFCTGGISVTGDCKTPGNQASFENCETLLKPKQGCISAAKPLVSVTDGTKSTQSYYAVAPINSGNLCS